MPGPVLVSSERKIDIDVLERARALIPILAVRSAATVQNRRVTLAAHLRQVQAIGLEPQRPRRESFHHPRLQAVTHHQRRQRPLIQK